MKKKTQTLRVSAYGLIIEKENILLCRLSPIVEKYAGKWTLVGGGLDFGEDPKRAVVREVREETGLNAITGDLLDVDATVIEFSDKEVHAIRIIYKATVEPGKIVVEKNGYTDDVRWFSKQELKELLAANEIQLVSLAYKGLELWEAGYV